VTRWLRALIVACWVTGAFTIGRVGVLYAAMFTRAQGVIPSAWGTDNLLLSLWYTLPVLAILAAHEGGHWLAAKHYRVPTAGPFLFPWPSSWAAAMPWMWLPTVGVLGGFLKLRGPMPSKLAQWDIAWSGLMAGAAVTLLCTVLGAIWSVPLPSGHTEARIWTPWLLRALAGPNTAWHPLLIAARIGWCLTVVSLFPIPPADGGRLYWIIPSVWRDRRWQVWALGVLCLCSWVS
jgi:hypothetical protein